MKLAVHDSVNIIISSRKQWNETGLEIESGEEYIFTAEGSWKDLFKTIDADGYSNGYMNLFNKLKRSKDHEWFALIGSINKTADFLIGKNKQILFSQTGKLYCYANDANGFYWNNSGCISLKIVRIK